MVYLDWKRILEIKPDNFGDDEKEDLVESVMWYSPGTDVSKKQFTALVLVVQEILKYKVEQVESLLTAIDELAAKQGEEFARGRQELLEEIDDLRQQLEYQKRVDRESGFSDDQMRSELVRLEEQNDEMVSELQEREKELVAERAQVEKLTDNVNRLERERSELARELEACRDESSDHRRDSGSFGGSSEKVEELLELVRQKNRHIMQLLDDIEELESVKNSAQDKLTTVKTRLSGAETKIEDLTHEIAKLDVNINDLKSKVEEKDTKISALNAQIQELMEKKLKHEQDLDDFAIKLDARVEEWRRLLDSKDNEIARLKEKLTKFSTRSSIITRNSETPRVDTDELLRQEQEIKLLKETNLLLQTENKQRLTENEILKSRLEEIEGDKLEEKNRKLETDLRNTREQLDAVEKEVETQGKEISEVISQLREYERGEFGLSDAVDKIKKLEKKISGKNAEIENLVAVCNKLEIDKGFLEDENEVMREKLGLSPAHIVDGSSKVSKSTVKELRDKIELFSNEIVELKLKNRELKKKKVPEATSVVVQVPVQNETTLDSMEENYHLMVEENDSLRKGLHDVLKSIKSQSMGEIQATSLERLLEALDMRHVSGWYHPAMRLQAQIHTITGEGNELRARINVLSKENQQLLLQLDAIKSNSTAGEQEPQKISSPLLANQPDEKSDDCTMLEVIDYKMNLEEANSRHEQKEALWQRERRSLIRERDSLRAEKQALTGQTDVEDYSTDRENQLEYELNILEVKYFKMKEEMLLENIRLKKENAICQLQAQEFEKKLDSCVSKETYEAMKHELTISRMKYTHAMNNSFVTGNIDQEAMLKDLLLISEVIQTMGNELQNNHDKELSSDVLDPSRLQKIVNQISALVEKAIESMKASREGCETPDIYQKLEENFLKLENAFKLLILERPQNINQSHEKCLIERKEISEFLKLYKNLYRSILQGKSGQYEIDDAIETDALSELTHGEETNSLDSLNKETSLQDILIKQLQILFEHLARLHTTCQNALSFPRLDKAIEIMTKLKLSDETITSELQNLKEKEQNLKAKEDDLEIQLASVNELKCAMMSDTSSMVNWHNKTTELKLMVARYERQNSQLREQLDTAEKQNAWCKKEISNLEEEAIASERKWMELQMTWENSQIELLKFNKDTQSVEKPHPVTELEIKLQTLEKENYELVKEAKQKDAVFAEILTSQAQRSSPVLKTESKEIIKGESAVGRTLISLQEIIKQKEEQITRYQQLLKKSKDEFGNTSKRLQEELRNVHSALAQQSKAYSRLKHGMYQPARVDMEKYVRKVQGLEEELSEARNTTNKLSNELKLSSQEVERWRKTAIDTENQLEDTKERLETEIQRLQDELCDYQEEVNKWRNTAHGDKVLLDKVNELQVQLSRQQENHNRPKTAERSGCYITSHGSLVRKLEACNDECARLRKQIEVLGRQRQTISRPRPADQETLVDKIKKLEETLQISKQHEHELEERGLKRIRSVEEVTRWDERKRQQKTLEKLKTSLKQKEVEADVANKKLETFRGLMAKVERDKNLLEAQVRNLTESARERRVMENLMGEKLRLEEQVSILETELAAIRHRMGPGGSPQEMDEIQNEMLTVKRRNNDLEKETFTLKAQIEKVQMENRKIETIKKNRPSTAMAYEIQRELSNAKERIHQLNERIANLTQSNENLVVQIKHLQSQLELWEERDLNETLARTKSEQTISRLHQELLQVKSDLAHKSHLLGRVKVLLCRAAEKEKALNEKVSALQRHNQ